MLLIFGLTVFHLPSSLTLSSTLDVTSRCGAVDLLTRSDEESSYGAQLHVYTATPNIT